ncbi:MAG: pyrrolo-quinoline quinone, partial [Verrucomicrobiota bacterium]
MKSVLLGVALAAVSSLAVAAAESWPQWRGPSRDGRTPPARWPDRVDEMHLKSRWRVKLGPSYSGPIVAEDRVFTTETRDKQAEVVRAYDRATGRELWTKEWEGAMSVPF